MVTSNVRHDTMLDFRAIDPASIGDGTAVKLPTGVYEVFISEAKNVTSKQGKPQTEFKCKVKDPKYGGTVRTVWIGHSQGAEDKVQYVWIRAFQSIGITPEQLKAAGVIQEDQVPAFFTGKTAYIEWTEANVEMGQNASTDLITPAAFKVKSEAIAAALAAGTAPPPTGAQARATSPGNGSAAQAPAAQAPAAQVPASVPAFTASIPTQAPGLQAPSGLAGMFGGGAPAVDPRLAGTAALAAGTPGLPIAPQTTAGSSPSLMSLLGG